MNAKRVEPRAGKGIVGLAFVVAFLVAVSFLGSRPAPAPQVMDPPLEQLGAVTTSMDVDDPVARSLLASEQHR